MLGKNKRQNKQSEQDAHKNYIHCRKFNSEDCHIFILFMPFFVGLHNDHKNNKTDYPREYVKDKWIHEFIYSSTVKAQ